MSTPAWLEMKTAVVWKGFETRILASGTIEYVLLGSSNVHCVEESRLGNSLKRRLDPSQDARRLALGPSLATEPSTVRSNLSAGTAQISEWLLCRPHIDKQPAELPEASCRRDLAVEDALRRLLMPSA